MTSGKLYRFIVVLLSLLIIAPPSLRATGPTVSKIEPPNWWVGLEPSPMIMLTGNNLEGATVSSSYKGVRVHRTQANFSGHYLFVWLDLAPNVNPGTVPLEVHTAAGQWTVALPLLPRRSASGEFQGISPGDVIYLIMPDRFSDGDPTNNEPAPEQDTYDRAKAKAWHGGDLKGVRKRLPYLRDLGVSAIWMTPFWKNDWLADDHSYHGYHVMDFYAVDEHLGSLSDFENLVAEAHRLGIKVVLDYVVNHVGPHNSWVADPPTVGWFHGTPEKHSDPIYSFNGIVDPHASAREYRATLEGWFAGNLPDLNPDEPYLAQYLVDNAIWWAEITGLDAFRLDTFPYSSRRFWSDWHRSIFHVFPNTATMAEVWDVRPPVTSFFAGGRKQFDGIDSGASTVFDFPLYDALRNVVICGEPVQKLIDVLQQDSLYLRPDLLVTFIGNHDTRRFMSAEGASRQKLHVAFALLLTMRGIPEIYYGDEIGMTGKEDPDNRHDFPGDFPGDERNVFISSGLKAEELETLSYFRNLLHLRKQHSALRNGQQWHIAWDETFYAFVRENPEDRVLVVLNNLRAPRTLSFPLVGTPLENTRVFKSLLNAPPIELHDGQLQLSLPATSVAIYEVK
jgi:glycosidase